MKHILAVLSRQSTCPPMRDPGDMCSIIYESLCTVLQTLYFLYDPGAAPGGDPMELGLTLIASVTSTGDGDSFSIP